MDKHQEHLLGRAMAKQAKKDGHVPLLPKGDNKPTRREVAQKDARNAKVVLDVIAAAPTALTTAGIQKQLLKISRRNVSYQRILRALKQLKALGKIQSEYRAYVEYHELTLRSCDATALSPAPIPFETVRINR